MHVVFLKLLRKLVLGTGDRELLSYGRKLQGSDRGILSYGRKLQGSDRELLSYGRKLQSYGRKLQGPDRELLSYGRKLQGSGVPTIAGAAIIPGFSVNVIFAHF